VAPEHGDPYEYYTEPNLKRPNCCGLYCTRFSSTIETLCATKSTAIIFNEGKTSLLSLVGTVSLFYIARHNTVLCNVFKLPYTYYGAVKLLQYGTPSRH
jgi:hypothetical protein